MKKNKRKSVKLRNLRELQLMKEKLRYETILYEKEIIQSSSSVVDNLTDKLKDVAYDVGTRMALKLITSWRSSARAKKQESDKTSEA